MTKDDNKTKISRRSFLKGVGTVTGGVAAGSLLGEVKSAEAFSLLREPEIPQEDRAVPSFCEVCFWNCGLIAKAQNNRVLSLEGHPDYPTANGKLCARGNGGAAFLQDKDRLKYPMIRVGKRGEGRFKRIGWDLAYSIIAEKFGEIKEKYGPEALALFYHGSGAKLIRQMMVAYGTPNFAAPAYAQCKGCRDAAFKLTYGDKFASPEQLDFDHTECMILFGSHIGENAHNSQVQNFVAARERGAKLIVLDPRLSVPASRADVWMPVQPGSDLAIILAWIHLAIKEEKWDKQYVAENCIGFEELSAHVDSYTPQWAAKESGIPVEEILRAWELIKAAGTKVMIHPGRHVTWYGEQDTQRARGQAILAALLGTWGRPGGYFLSHGLSLPEYPTPDMPDLPKNVDKALGNFPFALEQTTNGLRDATITGKPYPIKGWFVYATNILQSLPNIHETQEAIKNLDFFVVCDVQPTEITNWADILLPEDLYLERYDDIKIGRAKKPFIGLRQPVVSSPHDTRPAWRIAKELGTALGVGDYFDFTTFEEYLETRLAGSGTTLAYLKEHGIYTPKFNKPIYLTDGENFHFHTPSGKIELYCQQLKDAGFDPLPVYRPQPLPPKGYFRLLYGRSPVHTFGRTQNNPLLYEIDSENSIWINPSCAQKMGVVDQQKVMLTNRHGDKTGPLPVKITSRLPERVAYIIHGFGSRSSGLSRTFSMGGSDTVMIDKYAVDPVTGTTGMRTEFIHLEPASREEIIHPCD
jgi:thiosulfate reductase/polysulfide reductase chain A